MTVFKSFAAFSVSTAALLGACQSTLSPSLAVLESADEATLAEVKSVLAIALDRARIELGPGDLTATSAVTVAPPRLGPLERNSVAIPIVFDLMKSRSSCLLVRRDTGEAFELGPRVSCRLL